MLLSPLWGSLRFARAAQALSPSAKHWRWLTFRDAPTILDG